MKKMGLGILVFLVVWGMAACNSTSNKKTFQATLSGANEVPPVTTEGSGSSTATLDGKALTVAGTYQGLSGAAVAAHIHGPAAVGSNAGVVVNLTVTEGATAGSGTISGSATLTDEQVADLEDGKYYVNIHTAANAAGEIRGQLE